MKGQYLFTFPWVSPFLMNCWGFFFPFLLSNGRSHILFVRYTKIPFLFFILLNVRIILVFLGMTRRRKGFLHFIDICTCIGSYCASKFYQSFFVPCGFYYDFWRFITQMGFNDNRFHSHDIFLIRFIFKEVFIVGKFNQNWSWTSRTVLYIIINLESVLLVILTTCVRSFMMKIACFEIQILRFKFLRMFLEYTRQCSRLNEFFLT